MAHGSADNGWLTSDHIHLYIDASPEYAFNAIVHTIMDDSEQQSPVLPPEVLPP